MRVQGFAHGRLADRRGEAIRIGRERTDEGVRPGACGHPERGQSGPVGVGPARRVEPAGAEARHGVEQFVAHRARKHAQDRGVGERGVGEMDGAQVRAQLAERGSDECQVVVLDQDPAAVRGDRSHALGDQLVEARGYASHASIHRRSVRGRRAASKRWW